MGDEVLEQKLLGLEDSHPVSSLQGFSLTTPANHPRVSFPYHKFTPAEKAITQEELIATLGYKVRDCDTVISIVQNASSDPKGTCLVTKYFYRVPGTPMWFASNAHAGSHADQPYHWLGNDAPYGAFDDRQYNGAVTVLDLTDALAGKEEPVITDDMLMHAIHDNHIDMTYVRRFLLRTYHETPKTWDKDFAYLADSAARIVSIFPRLVMFGTDAPSIDAETASPIAQHAHGILWTNRVAILEGYNSDPLPQAPRIDGQLRVDWIPQQIARDAKGARISFYTMPAPRP